MTVIDKGLMGSAVPTRQVESFNLDAVINGEHVLLACDDPKGCESPAAGSYDGEVEASKWIHLSLELTVSHKVVTRWFKISGAW